MNIVGLVVLTGISGHTVYENFEDDSIVTPFEWDDVHSGDFAAKKVNPDWVSSNEFITKDDTWFYKTTGVLTD